MGVDERRVRIVRVVLEPRRTPNVGVWKLVRSREVEDREGDVGLALISV
jgi:hypothetical protein